MRFFSGFLNTAKIKHILQKPCFLAAYRLYEVFFSLGHAAGLLLPLFVAARCALELRRGRPLSGALAGERRHLALVVAASLPVLLHAILYNLIGAENERFFLRSTPYLFVLGNYLLGEQWERTRPSAHPSSRTDRGPARRA